MGKKIDLGLPYMAGYASVIRTTPPPRWGIPGENRGFPFANIRFRFPCSRGMPHLFCYTMRLELAGISPRENEGISLVSRPLLEDWV